MKIIKCRIDYSNRYYNDIYVTFEDGNEELLYRYYPDELSFSEDEFIGMTEKEAHDWIHYKDIQYLRS